MNGWMGKWTDRWMNGQIDGWVDRCGHGYPDEVVKRMLCWPWIAELLTPWPPFCHLYMEMINTEPPSIWDPWGCPGLRTRNCWLLKGCAALKNCWPHNLSPDSWPPWQCTVLKGASEPCDQAGPPPINLVWIFPRSQLPSNFSSSGSCQVFMAIWLSYPSRWLVLIYAEINVQNLICLIAPETWGVGPKRP